MKKVLTLLALLGVPAERLFSFNAIVKDRLNRAFCSVILASRTNVDALVRFFVRHDEVVLHGDARIRDHSPVDGFDVTELGVLFQSNSATLYFGQAAQTEVFHGRHLVRDQRVVVEELPASDDGQVREDLRQRPETVDTVQQEVIGDLREVGEDEPVILTGIRIVDQEYLQGTLDNRTVCQILELLDFVPNVSARAH